MTLEYVNLSLKACVRYLKNRHIPKAHGERVIIAGNGPSLEGAIAHHADLLATTPLFCVNFFAESPDYPKLKPLYYGMMDPAFSLQDCIPRLLERREKILSTLMDNTDWDMHMFFPLYPGQMILEERLNKPNLHLHLLNIFPPFTIPKLRNPVYKTGFLMPPQRNVLISAIYLCLNMGYKEICLLGADHSWTRNMIVKDDNILYSVNKHFDGTSTESPIYQGRSGDTWKMHEFLGVYARVFRSYHLLREYADYRGASVYNLTPDSFIDAFERKTLDELAKEQEVS